ncbi:MAG TPA: phosphotransferase [Legionellaceae bacterium]|nr:phosphotransferase [Legionellaceae bacterium]
MQTRENALHQWLKTLYPDSNYTLTSLAGDASFRRYYRLQDEEISRVIMDAPPDKLSLTPFVQIGKLLTETGLITPQIYALDHQQGFAVLEDFGTLLFSEALEKAAHFNSINLFEQNEVHRDPNGSTPISQMTPNQLYTHAITVLHQMQSTANLSQLAIFNQAFMLQELNLFSDWFLNKHLGISLTNQEQMLINDTFYFLTQEIETQPQVLIHRDYHSRNIMLLPKTQNTTPSLGIIDFQDAMLGPLTYDLVSLLKDCYIQLSQKQIHLWLQFFYDHSSLAQIYAFSDFQRAFDWCGLQRHLRILGTFCRLHLRDGKSNYLKDLPLTYHYVITCVKTYPEFHHFARWLEEKVHDQFVSTYS